MRKEDGDREGAELTVSGPLGRLTPLKGEPFPSLPRLYSCCPALPCPPLTPGTANLS